MRGGGGQVLWDSRIVRILEQRAREDRARDPRKWRHAAVAQGWEHLVSNDSDLDPRIDPRLVSATHPSGLLEAVRFSSLAEKPKRGRERESSRLVSHHHDNVQSSIISFPSSFELNEG